MKFIQGHNRTQTQLFTVSPDQSIDPGNEVRIIGLFVGSLSIKDYGFRVDFPENRRPAYNLRRIGNILTRDRLIEYLRIILSLFLLVFNLQRGSLEQFYGRSNIRMLK